MLSGFKQAPPSSIYDQIRKATSHLTCQRSSRRLSEISQRRNSDPCMPYPTTDHCLHSYSGGWHPPFPRYTPMIRQFTNTPRYQQPALQDAQSLPIQDHSPQQTQGSARNFIRMRQIGQQEWTLPFSWDYIPLVRIARKGNIVRSRQGSMLFDSAGFKICDFNYPRSAPKAWEAWET